MRRPKRFHKNTESSWSEEEVTMESVPQSPSRMSLRSRNTGFPESFCGQRNTSLPHPDAKIGPNACIAEEDIPVDRAAVRHRMSIMVGRDRSRALTGTTGSSILSSSTSETDHNAFCASPVALGMENSNHDNRDKFSAVGRLALTSLRGAELTTQLGNAAKEDGDSFASVSSEANSSAANSPTHPPTRDLHHPQKEGKRRRSFLRRLTHR